MFKSILVPLDGSELSERALPYARVLAGSDGRLILTRATAMHWFPGANEIDVQDHSIAHVEAYLDGMTRQLLRDGVRAEWHLYFGPPAEGIREEVPLQHADSVLMSTHGRAGVQRLVQGSVAEHVFAQARVPVALIPARCRTGWPVEGTPEILVPLDGSRLAEAALEPAIALAGRWGGGLRLLSVIEPLAMGYYEYQTASPMDPEAAHQAGERYLDELRARLQGRARFVVTDLSTGSPAGVIAGEAADRGAAAIVMATHGRTGLAGLLLGSVTAAVMRRSVTPLVVVRPLALASAAAKARPAATRNMQFASGA